MRLGCLVSVRWESESGLHWRQQVRAAPSACWLWAVLPSVAASAHCFDWTEFPGTAGAPRSFASGTTRLRLCLFADDVVMLVSWSWGHQRVCRQLGREPSPPSLRRWLSPRRRRFALSSGSSPRVEESCLAVLFTSEGRIEREAEQADGSAGKRPLYRSVAVKKQLSGTEEQA